MKSENLFCFHLNLMISNTIISKTLTTTFKFRYTNSSQSQSKWDNQLSIPVSILQSPSHNCNALSFTSNKIFLFYREYTKSYSKTPSLDLGLPTTQVSSIPSQII